VQAATFSEGLVSVSTNPNDSARVTMEAELVDEFGFVLDTETRQFTVRREQKLEFVNLPEVTLGDSSFAVTVTTSPDEGQGRGFTIVDGPGEVDATTGRVNVYGTGGILLQAFANQTSYSPADPEAELVQQAILNRTLVVGGSEPSGGPGFLDLWTWQEPQLSLTDFLFDVAVNTAGNQFVAVGANGRVVQGSDPEDPSTWTKPSSGTSEHLLGVTRGATRYVAVGSNGAVTTSPAGLSWSTAGVSGIDPTDSLRTVGFDPDTGQYVAAGEDAMGRMVLYSSADGLSWAKDGAFLAVVGAVNAVEYSSALGFWQVVGDNATRLSGAPGSWSFLNFGFGTD